MSNDSNRANALAALIILVCVGAALYFLPTIVLSIGQFSPGLAVFVGSLVVVAFFAIFWIRSRYQKR